MAWQSSYVSSDERGRLTYRCDAAQNRIPDFSYAGYHLGERDLPDVPAVAVLDPVRGDNTRHIQGALDAVAGRPLDRAGRRGAVLLRPGVYPVHGVLRLGASGVVLRGSGDGGSPATGTILLGVGDTPHQRTLVVVGSGRTAAWMPGEPIDVIDELVPVSARRLQVADPSRLRAGQEVVITHPSSPAWIRAVDGGGVSDGARWTPGSKDIVFVRRVVRVDGRALELDAPIYAHLDRALSQSRVAPVVQRQLVSEAGVEDLRIDIETRGGSDEEHAWSAIGVVGAEDCWVRRVTTRGFGKAGVYTAAALRITVCDAQAIEPVAVRTGQRMYNFDAEEGSQLVLFSRCRAAGGRHPFVCNGVQTSSGIVFHRCQADSGSSEAHRHWSQALLFDNVDVGDGSLALINRGTYGTGHGWAAVHSVLWSCTGRQYVQRPPTGQNYAISARGHLRTGYPFPGPAGAMEQRADTLVPASLYEAQLEDRLRDRAPRPARSSGAGLPPGVTVSAPPAELEAATATVRAACPAWGARPWIVFLVPYEVPPERTMRRDAAVRSFATSCAELARTLPTDPHELRTFRAAARALELHDCDVYVRQLRGSEPVASTGALPSHEWVIPHAGDLGLLDACIARVERMWTPATAASVVVDDPITAAHAALARRHDRVRFLATEPARVGPYVGRHEVCERSAGDLLLFQDSDDLPCGDRVAVQVRALADRGLDLVGCHELRVDVMRRQVCAIRFPLDATAALDHGVSHAVLFPSVLARRAAVLAAGGFSTVRRFASDTQFLLRAHFSARIGNVDEFLYVRRLRPGSLTTDPATALGTAERSRLGRSWRDDFARVRSGTLALADSSLAVEHARAYPSVLPLAALLPPSPG